MPGALINFGTEMEQGYCFEPALFLSGACDGSQGTILRDMIGFDTNHGNLSSTFIPF